MIRVAIIDDEEMTIKLLRGIVPWEELGYTIIGTASDGLEGIELYDTLKPQLMIVDIRMPIMDGLQLIEAVKKKDTDVKIIILSAYGEFEYAQRAIQYSVSSYLLKPLNEDKLTEMLVTLKDDLTAEQISQEMSSAKNLHHLLEKAAAGQVLSKKEWELHPSSFPISLFVVMHIQFLSSSPVQIEERVSLIEKWSTACPLPHAIIESDNEIIVGLFPKQPKDMPSRADVAKDLAELWTGAGMQHRPIIGCSDLYQELELLHECCAEALQAAKQFFYDEDHVPMGHIYMQDDTARPFVPIPEEYLLEHQLMIYEKIQTCDQAYMSGFLESSFQLFARNRNHPDDVIEFCDKIAAIVKKIIHKLNQHTALPSPILMKSIKHHEAPLTCRQLKQFMSELLTESLFHIEQAYESSRSSGMVWKAKAYTLEHYQENSFSIQDAADYAGLSKSHFSKLFKEHTNENFWDYVIKLRIEKAKQELKHSNKTHYEIAQLIGYESEYHFSRIFHKTVGMTPSQFRKSCACFQQG